MIKTLVVDDAGLKENIFFDNKIKGRKKYDYRQFYNDIRGRN